MVENSDEYKLLPFQFSLLTAWGVWSSKNWSPNKSRIHKIYFIFIFFLDSLNSAQMLIYFIISIGTSYFKLTNFFFLSAITMGVYKGIKIMRNRENLRYFISYYFNSQWTECFDSSENYIHEIIDLRIRNVTIAYTASMIGILFLKAVTPLINAGSMFSLPVEAWYPYSIENLYWFWLTYLHQLILGCSAVSVHIGVDTLFVGLLLKGYGQIDILKHRLRNLTKFYETNVQRKMIFRCIQHHERINRYGDDLNVQFQEILIILVITSLPNICINIHALSVYQDDVDIHYIATFFCTTSAFLQFFIACWFSNEVSLNSVQISSAVYEMDWTPFDASTQKLLLFIMTRSLRPIQFYAGYFIPLNLNSFIMIIKASYTAFNMLQRTSN